MKTILFVSFYFWPYSLVGAKRTINFANFLSENDFNIIVIKAHNIYYKNNIDKNIYIAPHIKIYDVYINETKNRNINILKFYKAFKKKIEEILNKNKTKRQNFIDIIYFSGGPFYYFSLGPYFKKKYGIKYILDFRDIWFRHKFFEMHKYKGIEKFTDAYLEKKTIKYSDLVIDVTEMACKIHQKIYKKYINLIYKKTNKINSKANILKNLSLKKIKKPKFSKFITIYNGYESINNSIQKLKISLKEKNDNAIQIKKSKEIIKKIIENDKNVYKLGIFGKFEYYAYYYKLANINKIKNNKTNNSLSDKSVNDSSIDHVYWLINLLKYFNNNSPNSSANKIRKYGYNFIKVYVIGKIEENFLKKVEKENAKDYFVFTGPLNYEIGIEFLKSMNLLILNTAFKVALGTKIFDYIFLNKPIVAFNFKNSEISNLLSKFSNGFVCEKYEEFIKSFEYIFNNNISILDRDNLKIAKYSRQKQADKLKNYLISLNDL